MDNCIYVTRIPKQRAPDRDFIIDTHPDHSNITMAIVGSMYCYMLHNSVCVFTYNLHYPSTGHGFKLAPVVGKILTEMIMELPLSYDITRFSLKRFDNENPELKN